MRSKTTSLALFLLTAATVALSADNHTADTTPAYAEGLSYKTFAELVPQTFWPLGFQIKLGEAMLNLEEHLERLLTQGNEYYAATLYAEATDCYEESLAALSKNIALEPTTGKLKELAFLLCRLGKASIFSGRLAKATTFLQAAESHLKQFPAEFNELRIESLYYLGEIAYQSKKYAEAITYFEKGATSCYLPKISCQTKCAEKQALCHWLLAIQTSDAELQHAQLQTAWQTLKRAIKMAPCGHSSFSLAQCLLTLAKQLQQTEIPLPYATLPRNALAENCHKPHKHLNALKWAWKAIDMILVQGKPLAPSEALAKIKFLQAEQHIQTYQVTGEPKALKQARKILSILLDTPETDDSLTNRHEEMRYLHAAITAEQALIKNDQCLFTAAEHVLWRNILDAPKGAFADKNLYTLACLYMHQERYEEAENAFSKLLADYPHTSTSESCLYWCAQCAEKLKRPFQIIQKYRKQLFEEHATSPMAAAAYFQYYPYRDYLQGSNASICHLQEMPARFPSSPLLINSFYLIGLDHTRERKIGENHSVKMGDLRKALEAFKSVETIFDELSKHNIIAHEQKSYYANIYCKALLERALINRTLANRAQNIEREICLKHAEELLCKLHSKLEEHKIPFSPLHEEALYTEIQLFMAFKDPAVTTLAIENVLQKYHSHAINKGYYLSCIHIAQGSLHMHAAEYEAAWTSFMRAESCDKGIYLSIDQRLSLWIQQALCYAQLGQVDKAMLILSRVINHDVASSLRIQAMYQRAELYLQQGRRDLARKQLEATSKKGGEWALKAKETLATF